MKLTHQIKTPVRGSPLVSPHVSFKPFLVTILDVLHASVRNSFNDNNVNVENLSHTFCCPNNGTALE